MNIQRLFESKKVVYSLEVFPPKKTTSIDTIYNTLYGLRGLKADFISVTYGAGGSEAQKNKTCEIASLIKSEYQIEPVSNLTCVGSTKQDIIEYLDRLKEEGVQNILALRGDRNPSVPERDDFKHADDLTRYLKSKGDDFCIAGACYPEKHFESESFTDDIKHLKQKVDLGAEMLISQLFFDNNLFYDFVEKARIAGINVPIEAGIMPVVNKKQIERMVSMCGASLPRKFVKMIQKYENRPEALVDAGIAFAIDQIVDLVSNGVDGIHIYTMNNPYIAKKITESIKGLL